MSTESVTSFSQLALAAPVLKAINEVGYETPSPIQAESIPPLLAGRDLLGQAQTGTGKTAAFALPLLSRLDLTQRRPQVLVLTPTRELAIQVAEAMQKYARYLPGFHVLPVYGGQGMGSQLRQLQRGAHVIVGTPGRVLDHLRRRTLILDAITGVVLDEADEMLKMGFIDDVDAILGHTPEDKQVALFSATMPKEVRRIALTHQRDPVEIRIKSKTTTVETINQRYWQVSGLHKLDALTRILEAEEFDAMLLFVRTKTATVELAERLEARGYSCAPLNGDMNQPLRERTVERFKSGALDIVVATDVAARGLDVERISHVVNYDIPYDTEAYVHRIGRTGRAGRKGEAILFVSPRERRMLAAIERATRSPITPMQLPTREDVANRRIAQFRQLLSDTLEAQELDFYEEVIAEYQRDHDVGLGEIAAALAYLAQRERPLQVAGPAREEQPVARSSDFERPRSDRPRPERRPRSGQDENVISVGYRIEVGREHGVEPKHIVGAIANEAGLDSRYIGRIEIFDEYSTLDLPDGMPRDLFMQLKRVRVCGQPLEISRISGPAPGLSKRPPAKRPARGGGDDGHAPVRKRPKAKHGPVGAGKKRPAGKRQP